MATITPERVKIILNKESGIRLLKAKSAPIVISFLYNAFRKNNIQEIPYDKFRLLLEDFLNKYVMEEVEIENDIDLENINSMDLTSRVKSYVEDWFSDNKNYIFRYYNQNKEEMIRPSPSVIRVFSFIDSIEESDFISTESSFNYILSQLRNLSDNMDKNPEMKIMELKGKIKDLENEIKEIERTGLVKTFDSRKITEYLTDVKRRSRDMQGEFSQVEENFKRIMTDIARKQASEDLSKRRILSYSLALHNELNSSPQGQSFNGFWDYISSNKEDELSTLSDSIIAKLKDNEIDYDASFLLNLRSTLFNAGNKIVEKNHVLTDRMSRVMAQSNRVDRKGIEKLITEIKRKSIELLSEEKEIKENDFMLVDDFQPTLSFPLSRTLREKEEARTSSPILFEEEKNNLPMILSLLGEFSIDEKLLMSNILSFSKEKGGKVFTLKELITDYPITKGLEEIVAYISVFKENGEKVDISNEETEEISYKWDNGKTYKVTLPKVVLHL